MHVGGAVRTADPDLRDYQPAKVPVPTGFLAGDGAAFGPRGGGLSLNNARAPPSPATPSRGRRLARRTTARSFALMNADAARVPTARAHGPALLHLGVSVHAAILV